MLWNKIMFETLTIEDPARTITLLLGLLDKRFVGVGALGDNVKLYLLEESCCWRSVVKNWWRLLPLQDIYKNKQKFCNSWYNTKAYNGPLPINNIFQTVICISFYLFLCVRLGMFHFPGRYNYLWPRYCGAVAGYRRRKRVISKPRQILWPFRHYLVYKPKNYTLKL